MTYPDQTIMAGGDVPGNCFQAALAGVLGVSINAVPHFPLLGIHHWMHACVAWLEVEHGLIVNTSPDPSLGKVRLLHIINGQTERGTSHAVIGDTETGEMVHDPHPSRAGLTFINSRFYFHCKPSSTAEKRWPFVESPGEFTRRLCNARDHFGGDMLAAVRNVLIEDPPACALGVSVPDGQTFSPTDADPL